MAHEHIIYMMLVEAATIAEDLMALEKYVPMLEILTERDNHLPYLAVAKRAEGVAYRLKGAGEEAETCLKAALEIFRNGKMAWQTGRTLTELGNLAAKKEDQEKADWYYNQAMDMFEEIGAKPSFERARDAMNKV